MYYYELYIDSLFLLNFTMNLYLLLLVNRSHNRTATRIRLFTGAVLGGAGYCLMFLIPVGNMVLKLLFAALLVNGGMLFFVFRPYSVKAFLKLLESMLCYCFLMGGVFFLLSNSFKPFRKHMMTVTGILACGSLLWLIFSFGLYKRKRSGQKALKVILYAAKESKMEVLAIVDTGNSLYEPISGKPVSVLDKASFERLFPQKAPEGIRVIPYRSVGCERGIMPGYEIPELIIEQEGMKKVCSKVYIGVSDKALSSTEGGYQLLLHPALLEQ